MKVLHVVSAALLALVFWSAPVLAQTMAPQPAPCPGWTGAGLSPDRHLSIMLLHFDDVAISMAQSAQASARSASLKAFAKRVIAERTNDVRALDGAYRHAYGEDPPSMTMPRCPNGGCVTQGRMMRGGTMQGGMMQGAGSCAAMNGPQGMMGHMMSYGDGYQMMMGGPWWSQGNADGGFAVALTRLDAMQIAMATLGLQSTDRQIRALSRATIDARSDELARLAKLR